MTQPLVTEPRPKEAVLTLRPRWSSRRFARWLLLPILAALPALAEPPVGERPAPEIDQAFARMYNTDIHGAHALLDQ